MEDPHANNNEFVSLLKNNTEQEVDSTASPEFRKMNEALSERNNVRLLGLKMMKKFTSEGVNLHLFEMSEFASDLSDDHFF